MTGENISRETITRIENGTEEIIRYLCEKGYLNEKLPSLPKKTEVEGEATSVAYPILGIQKYLGMVDNNLRIAYFPSISLCHDSLKTVTHVKFDPGLKEDVVIIDGRKEEGRARERVMQMVDAFRIATGIKTKILVVSKNYFKEGTGKGLGTSSSGGGALSKALITAAFGEAIGNNKRLVSIYARLLSGSATRSATGGISLWLSHPEIEHKECYAVRIDDGTLPLKLAVIPMPMKLKTEKVHDEALLSPFYEKWASLKPKRVLDLIKAIESRNIDEIGRIAEEDTRMLRAVMMTGPSGIIAWEPETIALMQMADELKKQNIPAYYSIDTGPSIAILTTPENLDKIKSKAEETLQGRYQVITSNLAEGARLATREERETLIASAQSILEELPSK